jgi:hypothetical protein
MPISTDRAPPGLPGGSNPRCTGGFIEVHAVWSYSRVGGQKTNSSGGRLRKAITSTATLLALAAAGLVSAQSSGGDFEIVSSTIDGGGGLSAGGEFSLHGSIGQPEAGPTPLSGGEFTLTGGFWASSTADEVIFSDGFENTP